MLQILQCSAESEHYGKLRFRLRGRFRALSSAKALLEGGAEAVLTGRNEQNLQAARRELGLLHNRRHGLEPDERKGRSAR
jgi:hypothetical protein